MHPHPFGDPDEAPAHPLRRRRHFRAAAGLRAS
jgi:hypothetical protein